MPRNRIRIPPSATAERNWRALSESAKHAAVAWAADYMHEHLSTYRGRLGVGVNTVGYGSEEWTHGSRSQSRPTLIVHVKKQFRASFEKKTGFDEFPSFIQLTVPVKTRVPVKDGAGSKQAGGRRYRYAMLPRVMALPIKVIEEKEPSADAAAARVPQEQRLFVSDAGVTRAELGSACTLIRPRDIPDKLARYVLSCSHVVRLTKKSPGMSSVAGARSYTVRTPPGSNGDLDSKITYLGPGRGPEMTATGIDAGWIEVNSSALEVVQSTSFWRAFPSRYFTSLKSWHNSIRAGDEGMTLYPWGQEELVPLKYVRHVRDNPVTYGSNVLRIKEVFVFRCLRGLRSLPGYSGSPVMTGGSDGKLAGMHIAGDEDDGSFFSYVIPAYLLMEPGPGTIYAAGFRLAAPMG